MLSTKTTKNALKNQHPKEVSKMGKWTDADTSAQTGDSSSKVAEAAHDARDHATKSGDFERGSDSKNSERFSRSDESGEKATSFWKSIFG